MTTEPKWKTFLEDNKWTTYLAYELKNSSDPVNTLLKYEALLTQCSYLSRMAYCPADIFCRMTQHLDVTPNAFNVANNGVFQYNYNNSEMLRVYQSSGTNYIGNGTK